jgi:hypothetical protein
MSRSCRPCTPPLALATLNAASMPSFIFWPSSLAGPVKGAEIPKRISLAVTPRTAEAGSLAPPTVATCAGASLACCATGGASGGPAAGELSCVGCGAIGAIARPVAGKLAWSGVFELPNLDVSSGVLGLDPGAFPPIFRKAPVINNPIMTPNTPAMMNPPLAASHPSLRGIG